MQNWKNGDIVIAQGQQFGRVVQVSGNHDGKVTGRVLSPETHHRVTKDLRLNGLDVDEDKAIVTGPANHFTEASPDNIRKYQQAFTKETTTQR